jgi:hypothetical protein
VEESGQPLPGKLYGAVLTQGIDVVLCQEVKLDVVLNRGSQHVVGFQHH